MDGCSVNDFRRYIQRIQSTKEVFQWAYNAWNINCFKFEALVISNLAILTYVILFCHNVQYIISNENSQWIYTWATLRFIGNLFPKQKQMVGIFFSKKSSFRIKLIFVLVGTLISISAVFGAQKLITWSYKSQCIHYQRLLVRLVKRRHRWPNYYGQ